MSCKVCQSRAQGLRSVAFLNCDQAFSFGAEGKKACISSVLSKRIFEQNLEETKLYI